VDIEGIVGWFGVTEHLDDITEDLLGSLSTLGNAQLREFQRSHDLIKTFLG